jgi:hypothetical protein
LIVLTLEPVTVNISPLSHIGNNLDPNGLPGVSSAFAGMHHGFAPFPCFIARFLAIRRQYIFGHTRTFVPLDIVSQPISLK